MVSIFKIENILKKKLTRDRIFQDRVFLILTETI